MDIDKVKALCTEVIALIMAATQVDSGCYLNFMVLIYNCPSCPLRQGGQSFLIFLN